MKLDSVILKFQLSKTIKPKDYYFIFFYHSGRIVAAIHGNLKSHRILNRVSGKWSEFNTYLEAKNYLFSILIEHLLYENNQRG